MADLLLRLQGLIGILVLLLLAVALSSHPRRIDWRLVGWGLALQFGFALLILRTPVGEPFFELLNTGITRVVDYSGEGMKFVFRPFEPFYATSVKVVPPPKPEDEQAVGPDDSETAETTAPSFAPGTKLVLQAAEGDNIAPQVANLAFAVLPTIIFFSALMAVLYHVGLMQLVVRGIARVMQFTMRTSGAETLSVAADIFVGQTEAPLVVRPFLREMTRSELMTVMTAGFATIAGGMYALYVAFLRKQIPDIAGHLMAASVMCAPASILLSKIMLPELETPRTSGNVPATIERTSVNLLDAFGGGVTQGVKLVINITAMLIAFVAAVALINGLLGLIPTGGSERLSLQLLLGWLFRPLAWCLGIPWVESDTVGTLLGEKLVLTELIAYSHLSQIPIGEHISERTAVITSYALCGFANFASIGVQLGGLSEMAPERRTDIAALVFRAMIAGGLATCLTAAIAGLLL